MPGPQEHNGTVSVCVCMYLSLCGHLAVIVPLILPRNAVYLFIYVFNYLPFSALWPLVLVSSRKPRLCVAILQSGGVALCLSCVCVRARWGGWCQRTLAEASVLKCNDTWFLLIHRIYTQKYACMRTIVVISSRQRKGRGERVAPRSSSADTPALAPTASDGPA